MGAVEVSGVPEVRRALRKVEDGSKDLKSAHAEAAAMVAGTAQQLVPRGETGRLASSVRSSGQVGRGVVRAGRASVPYAGPIHFGWAAHNIKPNPFLYDAADRRADEVQETYLAQLTALAVKAGLDTKGNPT